jgi:hypothetical protein
MVGAPDPEGHDEAMAWRDQLTLNLLRGLLVVFVISLVPV